MPDIAHDMRRSLARARDGKPLDVDEATVLLAARGQALSELMAHAARVRDAGLEHAGRPGVVTYSRKVFVPLTRLCRDRCHYCTFATTPNRLPAPFLSLDEVLQIARQGAALGCKEALFTLGDRPEQRWPAARAWLDEAGYGSTLAYVRACAVAVLEHLKQTLQFDQNWMFCSDKCLVGQTEISKFLTELNKSFPSPFLSKLRFRKLSFKRLLSTGKEFLTCDFAKCFMTSSISSQRS